MKRISPRPFAVTPVVIAVLMSLLAAACYAGRPTNPVTVEASATPAIAVTAVATAEAAAATGAATDIPSAEMAVPAGPASPARLAAEGELYVDAAAGLGTVNPLARGVTWGPLWPLSPQMTPAIQELRLGVISFPGGEYGDTVDLQRIEVDRFIDLSAAWRANR